mgnify:CR=1 FL=1
MSPRLMVPVTVFQGFPRVSGDEPASLCELLDCPGFSPRERG